MTDLVVMPDSEQLVIDYLTEVLPLLGFSAVVATRVPNPRPASSVAVIRTGGVSPTMVSDMAEISIDYRDHSESGAASLAQAGRAALKALAGQIFRGVMVYRIDEASGLSNYPDPYTPDEARYQQLMTIHVRGTVSAFPERISNG